MNRIVITGNLTNKPELRYLPNGNVPVTTFTVAVNNRRGEDATFFRCTVWRGLAENCAKHLDKGRKVAVVGEVSCHAYSTRNGEARASLDVNATDVEFLSAQHEQPTYTPVDSAEAQAAFTPEPVQTSMGDLPF